MKKKCVRNTLLAGATFMLAPLALLAQPVEKKVIEEKKKEVKQVIVTVEGTNDKKTVVEVDGEKITVNGKPLAEYKEENGDIKVKIRKVKDMDALSPDFPGERVMILKDGEHFSDKDVRIKDLRIETVKNKPMLGVTTEKTDKGVEVKEVTKESAAEKIGLKAGDIITAIDDAKIETPDDLSKAIQSHKPGDKVTVHYNREGKNQKAEAELGKWKGVSALSFDGPGQNFNFDFNLDELKELPRAFSMPNAPGFNWNHKGAGPKFGMSVQDTEDGKGVKVIDVEEESSASKAGIKENDIITQVDGAAVNGVDDIAKLLKEKKESLSVKMQVLRNGKSQTIDVKVPKKIKTADL